MMAGTGISATCTNLLPVDLVRRPASVTTTSSGGGASSASALSRRLTTRSERRHSRPVVASASPTTEPPPSPSPSPPPPVVVGDMERGSLAKQSGRSDGQLASRWREIHGRGDWSGLLDPIDTTLRGELIRYGEFSQACYDAFDYDRFSRYCGSSRYPPPTFFRDVALDGVGYHVTRFLYATSNARLFPSFSAPKKHKSSDPDARLWSETGSFIGFVAVSSDEESARIGRRDIAVAWRGTVTRLEWVADLTAAPRPVVEFGIPCPDRNAKVESGFAELYTGKDPACKWCRYSAREQALAEVRKLVALYHSRGEEVSVTVTGHSLGSALATLNAFDIAETGANVSSSSSSPADGEKKKAAPICVFSFSGPRVGNTRFKARLESRELGVKVLRVLNVHDKVPTVPGVFYVLDEKTFPEAALRAIDDLGLGAVYVHVGVELALNHRVSPYLKDTLDLACYHNLEAHLHLLDGYQGPRSKEFSLCGRDPALVNKAADFLREEHMVPPVWRQDENKGMVRTEDGRWVLPPRHRDVHDHPEDTDHHLQQLGLLGLAAATTN